MTRKKPPHEIAEKKLAMAQRQEEGRQLGELLREKRGNTTQKVFARNFEEPSPAVSTYAKWEQGEVPIARRPEVRKFLGLSNVSTELGAVLDEEALKKTGLKGKGKGGRSS